MRKVILFVQVSLDGFFEGPKKEIDWHMVDDELHAHVIEELKATGAFLSGRVTYELMAGFWPTADADPGSTPFVKEFARIWRDMRGSAFFPLRRRRSCSASPRPELSGTGSSFSGTNDSGHVGVAKSWTEVKTPRAMTSRSIFENQIST